MFLNVGQMRGTRDRIDRTMQPSDFAVEDGVYRVIEPVHVGFDIFKDDARFRLVGDVRTTLELPCSRCLEAYPLPVNASFELRYVPDVQNVGEDEREIEEDDLSTAYYQNDVIDLGHLLREQFYLALPMKPLCSSACRGLCPQCGTNLNRDTCSCSIDQVGSAPGGAQGSLEEGLDDAQSKATTLEITDSQAANSRRHEPGAGGRVPALSRAEAAAPGLQALRVLQGTPGAGGRGGLTPRSGVDCADEPRPSTPSFPPLIRRS